MTKDQLLADLDYASSLAKEGASTPLLGGPIGLMWGILLTLVFFGQWAIISDTIALPEKFIGYLWIAFAVIGAIGSTIIGKKIDEKPGANSVANRVEGYVWVMFAGYMATLFTGAVLNIIFTQGSAVVFNFLVVAGFAGQGVAYGVVAKLTHIKWIHAASFLSFSAAALCFSLLNDVNVYAVASLGAIITVVLPSLITMRNEPKYA